MPLPDILLAIQWALPLTYIGMLFLPLARVFFPNFFDGGYIFGKILGVAILSYLMLLLGTLHILPFSFTSLLILLIGTGTIIWVSLVFRKKKSLSVLFAPWKFILVEEILFFIALCFWAYIRGFSPDINGLEKYMDFGFINSILRSEYFPPKDMWLTPFSINYYYFGHFVSAVLTKFSLLPSNFTYNFMLGTVFAFCFTASFSLVGNLLYAAREKMNGIWPKVLAGGILAAFLITFSGNLHTLYLFFSPYENESPVPPWTLEFLPEKYPNSYWYPNATRFIYNTIHEFPIYSWVVADLHGHVVDIPFVLLTIAVLVAFFLRRETISTEKKQGIVQTILSSLGQTPSRVSYLVLTSFLLAVMYMTNAWDGLIYMLLTGLVVLTLAYSQVFTFTRLTSLFNRTALLYIASSLLLVVCGFIVFSLPFSLYFKPFVSGIGILCAPTFLIEKGALGPFLFEADHCQHSPWWQLLILYGFFLFFIMSFALWLLKRAKQTTSDIFVTLLIILSLLLILIPEFVYIKDIYPAHYRANTMFKLVFQAFMLLSLASAYIIVRILTAQRLKTLTHWGKTFLIVFLLFSAMLLTLVFQYPFQAISSYYNTLQTYSGQDGTKYLGASYPSDYEAIQWLNQFITHQPVILEAQGDSYTEYARVSANTGLPTVLGWTVHEWLWRGDYDIPKPPADPEKIYDKPAPRIDEVQTLYETTDVAETKRLVDKYAIELVFIGSLERQKYPTLTEDKWKQLGKLIFASGQTRIYQISK